MTSVVKSVLALGILCLAIVLGTSHVHSRRADRHVYRLLHYGRNEMYEDVVEEYHHLPENRRSGSLVQSYYEDAKSKVGDNSGFRLMPTFETPDAIALAVFVLGLFALRFWLKPKERHLYSKEKTVSVPDAPTSGQIAFIKRFNNGIVPVGLTKDSAAIMIKDHLAKLSMMSRRQQIDIRPAEFMSGSKSYREKIKLERERKRAQEKLARQQEQERRRQERETQKAQKAIDRLYDKRLAEEQKLIKAREDALSGVTRKLKTAKAQAIQELQNLVNDILADKKIEPQEVRQLKAWLIANRQSPDDFAPMLKLIDESLVDGIIDADETQAIYEGVIDCLLTLRERRSN